MATQRIQSNTAVRKAGWPKGKKRGPRPRPKSQLHPLANKSARPLSETAGAILSPLPQPASQSQSVPGMTARSSDAEVAAKAARFDSVASGIPDSLDSPVLTPAGATSPIAVIAAAQIFPPPIIGRAMDVLAKIASGIEGAEITLEKDERDCLIEAWEEPANRLAAKYIGESENGDIWGAVIVTALVFGAKTKAVREMVESARQMITGMFGSTIPVSSANPNAASPGAQPGSQAAA